MKHCIGIVLMLLMTLSVICQDVPPTTHFPLESDFPPVDVHFCDPTTFSAGYNGQVHVYRRNESSDTPEWEAVYRYQPNVTKDLYGYSVSCAPQLLIWGSPKDTATHGAVYLASLEDGAQRSPPAPVDSEGTWFGYDVAIREKGDIAIIGSPYGEENPTNQVGYAYIWRSKPKDNGKNGTAPTPFYSVNISDPTPRCGWSVDIYEEYFAVSCPGSGDSGGGEGAPQPTSGGTVYIYKEGEDGEWYPYQTIIPEPSHSPDYFGWRVKIHSEYLVISSKGIVFVYKNSASNTTDPNLPSSSYALQTILQSDGNQNYGYEVDLVTGYLAVGSFTEEGNETDPSQNYITVYKHSEDNWYATSTVYKYGEYPVGKKFDLEWQSTDSTLKLITYAKTNNDTRALIYTSVCGDNEKGIGDWCDSTAECCTSECLYAPAGTPCGAYSVCTGQTDQCGPQNTTTNQQEPELGGRLYLFCDIEFPCEYVEENETTDARKRSHELGTCPHPFQPILGVPLGNNGEQTYEYYWFSEFNIISFGKLNITTGDVRARIAARGDGSIGAGVSLGYELTGNNGDERSQYTSVFGGNLEWESGSLFPDQWYLFVGGNFNGPNEIEDRVRGTGCDSTCLDEYFTYAQEYYYYLSKVLYSLDVNTEVSVSDSTLNIGATGESEDRTYVATVTLEQLNEVTSYSFGGIEDIGNATLVINLNLSSSSNVEFEGGYFSEPLPKEVIWNFYFTPDSENEETEDTCTVNVLGIQIHGVILAPWCSYSQRGGHVIGSVIAANIEHLLSHFEKDCEDIFEPPLVFVLSESSEENDTTLNVGDCPSESLLLPLEGLLGNFSGETLEKIEIFECENGTIQLTSPLQHPHESNERVIIRIRTTEDEIDPNPSPSPFHEPTDPHPESSTSKTSVSLFIGAVMMIALLI